MKNRLFPLRTAARVAWALLFCVLLLLPLGLIYFVTQAEMRRYAVADVPSVTLRSYGAPSQVVRRDVAEYVVVSGQYISNRRFFMELPALNRQYEARWQVREGDYIEAGDVIGWTADGKEEIVATVSGFLVEIHLGQNSYLVLEDVEDLAFSCDVSAKTLRLLTSAAATLTDESGAPVELLDVSKRENPDGTTTLLLRMQDGAYGRVDHGAKLFTGLVYTRALVVNRKCLFHLSGDTSRWYVRVVTENGEVVGNAEVKIGFAAEDMVCVTGVEEGVWLDSGYAAIMGGGMDEADYD